MRHFNNFQVFLSFFFGLLITAFVGYHDLSNGGLHPGAAALEHPRSPLQEVLTAEALAHSDVILAAKGIQDSRESVYNSINGW